MPYTDYENHIDINIKIYQIHKFEREEFIRLIAKIAEKVGFQLNNHKLNILEKPMLLRGNAAKTLFPMTSFVWKRLYLLARCGNRNSGAQWVGHQC